MNKLVVLFSVLVILFNHSLAQDQHKTYYWNEIHDSIDPLSIKNISLTKLKIDSVPEELLKYKNIVSLDLSKNKLKTIPNWINSFEALRKINLYKNDFEQFPVQIFKLTQLDTLIISKNKLDSLPDEIQQLKKLKYLDLWDNLILYYPENISELTNLKTLDIRGITYGPTFIEKLISTLPWTTILYDEPCSCVE